MQRPYKQKTIGILGCTEIFLLIKPSDFVDLPMFNTTELHVNAVVEMALA